MQSPAASELPWPRRTPTYSTARMAFSNVGERELRSSGFVAGDDGVHQGDVLTDVAGDVG